MSNNNCSFLIVHEADSGRLGLIRALIQSRLPQAEFDADVALLEASFVATALESAELVSAITKLGDVTFELVCLDGTDARRWVFTPTLGLGSVAIDQAGNHILGENELLELVRRANHNGLKLERLIRQSLLSAWDECLEELREKQLDDAGSARRVG
ncbi:MAG: hypothetical protein RIR46_807 [Actinomycetota bacterium]